jgi:hypothetical protein
LPGGLFVFYEGDDLLPPMIFPGDMIDVRVRTRSGRRKQQSRTHTSCSATSRAGKRFSQSVRDDCATIETYLCDPPSSGCRMTRGMTHARRSDRCVRSEPSLRGRQTETTADSAVPARWGHGRGQRARVGISSFPEHPGRGSVENACYSAFIALAKVFPGSSVDRYWSLDCTVA